MEAHISSYIGVIITVFASAYMNIPENSITKHALLEETTSALVTSDTNSLVLMSSTILRLENLMQ